MACVAANRSTRGIDSGIVLGLKAAQGPPAHSHSQLKNSSITGAFAALPGKLEMPNADNINRKVLSCW